MNSTLKPAGIDLLFALIIAAFSILVTLLHTPYGTAMSMDSLSYLSAAQQMTLGHGVSTPNFAFGEKDYVPMTIWPPLYPITLFALIPSSQLFDKPETAIALINAISLFFTLLLFFYIAKKIIRRDLALIATLLVALSPSMQVVYMYAWSETIFIPIIVLAFYFQWKLFTTDQSQRLRWMMLSVATLTLAVYTRYAGLGFLAAFFASIFLSGRFKLPEAIRITAISLLLFSSFIAPLLVRNYLLTSTFAGQRESPNAELSSDIQLLFYFLKDEFFPVSNILLLSLIAISIIYWLANRKIASFPNHKETQDQSNTIMFLLLSFLWASIYLAFLIVNRQLSIMDLDPRMIAPTVPFFILGICAALTQIISSSKFKVLLAPVALLSAVLFFRAFDIHQNIISSWKTTGEPGVIQNIQYNTALNKSTRPLKTLQSAIAVPKGALLLTDITPTSFLQYFFPHARVKKLPEKLDKNLLSMAELTKPDGLMILTKPSSIELLDQALKAQGKFFKLNGHQDLSYFVFLKLPLDNQ